MFCFGMNVYALHLERSVERQTASINKYGYHREYLILNLYLWPLCRQIYKYLSNLDIFLIF